MDPMISSVLAAASGGNMSLAIFGAVIAAGVIIVGAALGVGFIGGKAVESIARQPEAGGRIFMTTIIAAALIEGVTFFALLICFLAVFWLH
ncbi:MAG TPA: ATP synthase F0 subunit C [Sedimentisphaerales bacterium]|jgi:F-type H+-transporting ATPase subunit c|nr:ATP synthase F0 subunit C [Sedimentisphaerales bacterium]HNU31477.1 ATP synthase F0 subunit C [Sedimentisphaerales bacterium]